MSGIVSNQMNISPGFAPLAWLRETVAVWRRRAWERDSLHGLDDRDLHDLGLSRAAAEFEASKPFWRG